MPHAEMLSRPMRDEAALRYLEWAISQGAKPSTEHVAQLFNGVQDSIYGHILASAVDLLSQDGTEPEKALEIADITAGLAAHSSDIYRANEEGARPVSSTDIDRNPEFVDGLADLQEEMVLRGSFKFMPFDWGFTAGEGRQQVIKADRALGNAGHDVGTWLANFNYDYFTGSSMANGQDLLHATIDEVMARQGTEKMPHLMRSNWAIGQIVSHIAARREGKLNILDIGSGTGGTVAAIVSGLKEAGQFEGVSIRAIEPHPGFVGQLKTFTPEIMAAIHEVDPDFRYVDDEDAKQVESGSFGIIHANMLDAVDMLKGMPNGPKDVTVITSNYAQHRIPTLYKKLFLQKLERNLGQAGRKDVNVAALVFDLWANGSNFNRLSANFWPNGIFNTGNLITPIVFREAGYVGRNLTSFNVPPTVGSMLVKRLVQDSGDDGKSFMAHKGAEIDRVMTSA